MKFIISVLLIFTIVATIGICVKRPEMHKEILMYDSGYTITQEEITTVEEYDYPEMTQLQQPETEKITVNEKIDNQIAQEKDQIAYYTTSKQTSKPANTTQTQTSTQQQISKQNQSSKTQQVQTPVQSTSVKVARTNTTQVPERTDVFVPTKTTTVTTPVTTPVQTTTHTQTAPVGHTDTTTVAHAPVGNTNVVVQKPKVVHQPVTQAPQPKVLTAQEEEIAWNKWRSNLQNRIMKDSRLPNMPLGTVFKFSFTVDKYGKVTNVKTWSTDARYTPYAIQYIAPTIRSYQGHSILNFPAGSNRVITDVSGTWRIATSATYSTPNDFNDIERVTR